MDSLRNDWNIEAEVELLRSAQYRLEVAGVEPAPVGIVLGSGLKQFADRLEDALRVPFNEIPEFPKPSVVGHGGTFVQGRLGDTRVHCLSGRVHVYEGYHSWEIVRAIRTLALIGTKTFVLTNAAGGIRDDLLPGTLMLITDHINLTAKNVLRGDHHDCLGPRFPALTHVWDAEAREVLRCHDDGLAAGVYVQMSGPSYETPAEIRMLATLGGDAVGMSTVPEAIAVHAMGCRVAGLSLITNRAAGLGGSSPNHAEVVEEGRKAAVRMCGLLARAIPDLAGLGQHRRHRRR